MYYYDIDYIFTTISKDIHNMAEFLTNLGKKNIDLADFLFSIIRLMQPQPEELLYITVSVIDLFQQAAESQNASSSSSLKLSELTNYFCEG